VKHAFAGLLALLLACSPPAARAADAVVVASKIDTEGALLGNLILAALSAHGIAVENRLELGPTQILRQAILSGQIDLYPEYTGNGGIFFKREADPVWHDAGKGYDAVKTLDARENDLVWLAPAPADNSWAIAVRQDFAARMKLATLEDFAAYVKRGGRVKLAASAEFVESPGALPAFEAAYGFHLQRSQLLTLVGGDTAATIRAAAEGISGVNAAMAYATDGALAALRLVVLADDKHAQTVYEPAPVIRQAVLAQHPAIPSILDPIFRSLTLTRLQQLNAAIAVEGEDAKAVAERYLQSEGLAK
jgi:osmoprotectant transport system substrate-binding protein